MQAVILAGGFGTRLRPVVQDLPKPMAPVNGKPFLEYLIANLKKMDFSPFIFCVHYLDLPVPVDISHAGQGQCGGSIYCWDYYSQS